MLLRTTHPRSIFRLAAACLALFGLLGIPRVASSFGEGLLDGVRGALLGAAVALLYLMFRLQRKLERGAR
jgi:hypothetical protein